MPTFATIEDMVAYLVAEYEPLPLETGDSYLEELFRLERKGRLLKDPETVILALRKRRKPECPPTSETA